MASTSSISGLGSGLDTAGIIDSLMQLEAAPQTKLKSTLSTEQSTLKVLQSLNAKIAALATQAQDLAKPAAWNALSARSSSTAVSVATTTGTSVGTFSFTVQQTAAAHSIATTQTAKGTDVVVGGSGTTVNLVVNGIAVQPPPDSKDGTLDGLVTALNGPGTGVSAAKVRLDDGSYRLVVNATQTGASGSFTLTNDDGSDLLGGSRVTSAGRDAEITLGTDVIHSASNTFTGVVPGVSLTVSAAAVGAAPVDVTVARDPSSAKSKVKDLVNAINDALTQIDAQATYNSTSKTAGPLTGDAGVRNLRTALVDSVYPGDGTSLAGLGIQTDRSGKLVLDEATFDAAYAADPANVAARLGTGTTDGFAARVAKVATGASDKYTGSITGTISGRSATIDRLTHNIEDWDTRLALRKASLTATYTALDTALNKLNSQSTWLAGQISSLGSS